MHSLRKAYKIWQPLHYRRRLRVPTSKLESNHKIPSTSRKEHSRKRSQRRRQKPKQTRIRIRRPLTTQHPPLPHQRIKRRPRLQCQRGDLSRGVPPCALPVQGPCYFAVDDLAYDETGEVGDYGERALVAHDVEVGDPAFVALVGLVGEGKA